MLPEAFSQRLDQFLGQEAVARHCFKSFSSRWHRFNRTNHRQIGGKVEHAA